MKNIIQFTLLYLFVFCFAIHGVQAQQLNVIGGNLYVQNGSIVLQDTDLEVAAAATLTTEVNSTSEYGQIIVNNGSVQLDGTVKANINYTPTNGDRIPFINSANDVSSTFTTEDLPSGWNTDYDTNSEVALVYLSGQELAIKVFLQGAYESNEGSMNAMINGLDDFPNSNGLYTIEDGVLDQIGDAAIVDWVMVELRSDGTNVVASRPALLQADGDVVDMDGSSAVLFEGLSTGLYHIVVSHRNHLSIMTLNAISFE